MNPNAALPTFRIQADTSVAAALPPPAAVVTLATPALEVMTDLTRVRAATTTPGTALDLAETQMIHQGVRMLFVATELPAIQGLVTSTDLRGDKAMRLVHERGVRRDELAVSDVMTPLAELDAVDFDALAHASVGNLVATLRRFGRHHLLVVQVPTAATPRRVRGVVSSTQIERQLGQRIELEEIASSFAEIERALA
jgi:CBS-domain-containing membrane protein